MGIITMPSAASGTFQKWIRMVNMISIGRGAGVAAALCAQLDTPPRQLDYKLIQEKLDEKKVDL